MSYSSLPTSKLFQFTFLTCALALAGCGGGDGTDIIAPKPDLGIQPGEGDGTGAPVESVKISPLILTDTNGNLTRVINSAGANAKVQVTDNLGKPISNALVTFEGEGVTFGTTNGTVLTNEKGEASISVKPADGTDTGSYQLRATTSYNDMTATTAGYNFTLQSIKVVLSNLVLSNRNLQSGASTNITLKTKDSTNNSFQNDVSVSFNASCGTFDTDSVVSSNKGDVTTTYRAIDKNGNLCEGTQTITVTPTNSPENRQTVTVNIAGVQASSVVYTTTEAVQLGASNSGSSSSGQIEFTIYANGRPAANQQVEISKIYAPTDFSFVTLNNQTSKTVTSDSQGKVSVNLYPGTLPGPVEIKAALKSDPTIFALSKNVSVATGRATQNGFSISLSKNVLANNVDGDTASITARLVDRVGNLVPNGTVVSFVSEGGRVQPNCVTNNGACSVEFSTQNPRPADNRITVVAYVEGDKSYTDKNGDNKYTIGTDILTRNIGDFFRDDNENNQYDSLLGEFLYKRGASGAACFPTFFNQPNILGTCDNGLAATLRYQFILGLASDTPLYRGLPDTVLANSSDTPKRVDFKMFGNSEQTVSMASGTSISVSAKGGSCKAELISGNVTVPNVVNLGIQSVLNNEVSYSFTYRGCEKNDKIEVTVNSPAPDATTTTTTIDII